MTNTDYSGRFDRYIVPIRNIDSASMTDEQTL